MLVPTVIMQRQWNLVAQQNEQRIEARRLEEQQRLARLEARRLEEQQQQRVWEQQQAPLRQQREREQQRREAEQQQRREREQQRRCWCRTLTCDSQTVCPLYRDPLPPLPLPPA